MLNLHQFKPPAAAENRRGKFAPIRLHSLHAGHLTNACFHQSQYSTVVTHVFINCYQFTDPEGWTVWLTVPAPGIEPVPTRLIVLEIVQRSTVPTRPRRQTQSNSFEAKKQNTFEVVDKVLSEVNRRLAELREKSYERNRCTDTSV